MERRSFLKQATAGVAAGAVAAPALAADLPTIKWRLASGFPKTLDAIYGATETVARRVAAATGGKFQIGLFAAGEIVPTPGVLDAVKDGTVEMGTQPPTGTSARTRPWPSTPPCPSV
jgi:TRAP-type mannitol/chloroaromatic compound transport system substrate-binding protein